MYQQIEMKAVGEVRNPITIVLWCGCEITAFPAGHLTWVHPATCDSTHEVSHVTRHA